MISKGWKVKVMIHNVMGRDVRLVTILVHPMVTLQELAKKVEVAMGYTGPSEYTRIKLLPLEKQIHSTIGQDDNGSFGETIASCVLQTPVRIVWYQPI
jgi:hypothetical protein